LPIHQGNGFTLAETGGVETVTLTVSQIPAHNHALLASANIAGQQGPSANVLAQSTVATVYIGDTADQALSANSIGSTGGSQPHNNFQPYLCVDFIISLFGIFPSQT
jgi:microcystin-dependent protein